MLTEKQKQIVKEVHDYVKEKSAGFAEDDIFNEHIIEVRDFAVDLAEKYGANMFVVEVSAYLHDIYFIQTHNHEIHETEGSKFAREFLKKYDLPQEEVDLIADCILKHRGSGDYKRNKLEERIIACADAMDHIDGFTGMFYRACKRMKYDEAVEWTRGKMQRGWEKIDLPEGRELVRKKYEAARVAFDF